MLGYLDISFAGSRPDRRRQARRDSSTRALGDTHDRRAADALRRDRDRGRHRPRNLAHARPAGRCDARLLRAARHISAGALGGRWLVDGALVNPVPVSAARALGARLVIAVNLNTDMFGRGTTIQDHGAEPERRAADRGGGRKPRPARPCSAPRRSLKRQFFGDREPARPSDRDGRGVQHHAGPHHARAARRRSARRHDQPARRPHRLVRFPPRRRRRSQIGAEAAETRARAIDEAIAALVATPAAVTPAAKYALAQAVWM